jgi:hypothetical protein
MEKTDIERKTDERHGETLHSTHGTAYKKPHHQIRMIEQNRNESFQVS